MFILYSLYFVIAPNKDNEVDPDCSHGEIMGGHHHIVKCNCCNKILYGGIHRLKYNLTHIFYDTKGCTNVPTEVRQQMMTHVLGKKITKGKKKKKESLK